ASTTTNTAATAMRIQNVAGTRSRLSSACLRATSVSTLVIDMIAASSKPIKSPRDQVHRAEQTRGQRLHQLHVLSLEALAEFGRELLIIRQRTLRQDVQRGVGHYDPKRVLAGVQ